MKISQKQETYFWIFMALTGLGVILAIVLTSKKSSDGGNDPGSGKGGTGFKPDPSKSKVDNTIAALQQVGAMMYGAEECGNTQNQLSILGGNVSASNPMGIYTQCAVEVKDTPSAKCMDYFEKFAVNGNISVAYPTWQINGHNIPGVQEIDQLYNLAVPASSSPHYQAGMALSHVNNDVCQANFRV